MIFETAPSDSQKTPFSVIGFSDKERLKQSNALNQRYATYFRTLSVMAHEGCRVAAFINSIKATTSYHGLFHSHNPITHSHK